MEKKQRTMNKGEKGFFALADIYGGGGQAMIGVLYFFFLTDIIALKPVLAGIVTLISEIWDAISDPLMGVLGDNTKTKMGRRRPYVLLGGCLLPIAFSLIFLPVNELSETMKFIYCAVTYLFYNTVSTMINVSYSSLSSEISTVSEERDSANVMRLVVSTVGAALCTLLPSVVLDMYRSGSIDLTTLYLVVGVGFGCMFAVPVILCAVFVRERVEVPQTKQKFDLREFIEPLKIRPFRQLVGMYLSQALCMDVFSTGVALFASYVTTPKGSVTLFLGIFIGVQLLAFPIVNLLIKKLDINKIYRFGLPLSIVALVFFALLGSNLTLAYICVFFVALGFAGAQLTSWIMFPHTVDAGELVSGKRQSGCCSAMMTFARKSSSALVIFLFSLVLEFTGYNEALEVQNLSAQLGIKYTMAFTCIVFMILGFIMAKRYVLSRGMNEKIQKYLTVKREQKLDTLSASDKKEYEELLSQLGA
ncbi:MAG: MFS transporter [Erysipelotrichaceae bacterium]|nr:MFS transporter [Erysipelotrichaceae bacterium]